VIDAIFCWSVSGTLGLGLALLAAVTIGLQTTAPTDVSSSIKTNLNGGPFDSKAVFGTGHTITTGTPAWCVVAARDQVSAVSVGSGLRTGADFNGSRVVTPGRELAMSVLAPVGTTALFGMGVEWHEVKKD